MISDIENRGFKIGKWWKEVREWSCIGGREEVKLC